MSDKSASLSAIQLPELPHVTSSSDTPQRDYWPAVETMIAADIGSRLELVIRFGVVALSAAFVSLATGQIAIALWLGLFLVINGYYSWKLSQVSAPVSQHQYVMLCVLFAVSVTLYTGCAVYLFLLGTPAYVTVAIAALIAQALFNLSRHRNNSSLGLYDTAIVASAGLFFGLSTISNSNGNTAENITIIVATVGVCSYYVIAQMRKIQIHKDLQASREEAVQTQKMRAVGQLTAGVAHEFNNMLTVIRGNIELAKLCANTAEYHERLDDAIKAGDRAHAMTRQLLSLSRKAQLEASVINLESFWQEFEKIIPRITPASIKVRVTSAFNASTLFCDAGQLEVALINLIANARDAIGDQGRIWINSRPATMVDIAALGLDRSRRMGLIEVVDDGPGIPPQHIEKVVEPFFTTKAIGKGTGLGLPMVKGFCEQSGGAFAIDSSPDGTAVRIALPMLPD